MVSARDILLGISGFIASLYGGLTEDILALVLGVLIIFLSLQLAQSEIEEQVKILRAQINTQLELKRLWKEIEGIKNVKEKR